MKKRMCSLMILGAFLATTVVPNIANAAVNQETTVGTTVESSSTISVQDAIKIIQDKYLVTNADGTLSISDKATDIIPSDVLSSIKSGLANTNRNIKQGNFSINNKNNDFKVDVKNGSKTGTSSISVKSNNILANHATEYEYYWWGFAAGIDSTGTNQLINALTRDRNILLETGTASAFVSCGIGVAASLVTAAGVEELINEAEDARDDTGSSVVYCYGSPSSCQVYSIDSYYDFD